jgi:hypothetical protein
VTGWLQRGEGSGTTAPNPADDLIPEMRVADAIQHVDQDLYGGYVLARRPTPGLVAVTPASLPKPPTFTAVRNLLYAVEWWVFGGFAVFLWWRWCRDELERQRAVDAGERAGEADMSEDGEGPGEPEVSGVTGVPSNP